MVCCGQTANCSEIRTAAQVLEQQEQHRRAPAAAAARTSRRQRQGEGHGGGDLGGALPQAGALHSQRRGPARWRWLASGEGPCRHGRWRERCPAADGLHGCDTPMVPRNPPMEARCLVTANELGPHAPSWALLARFRGLNRFVTSSAPLPGRHDTSLLGFDAAVDLPLLSSTCRPGARASGSVQSTGAAAAAATPPARPAAAAAMPGAGGSASLTAGLTHETLAALNAAQTGGQTPFLIVPPSEPSSSSLRSASTEPLPQVRRLMPVRLTGSWQGECPLAARHSPSCRWHPPPPAPTSPQVWQDLFACTRSAQSDAFLDSLASRPPLPPPAGLRPQGGQSSGSVAAVSARSGASGPVTEAGPATRPGSANSGPVARPEPPSAAAPPVGAPDAAAAAAAAAAEEGAIARGVVLGTAADDIDPSLGISRDTLFEQYLSPEALVQRHRLGKPEVRRLYQALQVRWEGCVEYHSCHMLCFWRTGMP